MSEPSDESREMVRQWAARKIERLEAELADLRGRYDAEVKRAYLNAGRASVAESELADLRASSVVVRERCQTCGGSGVPICPKHGDGNHPDCILKTDCPDCVDGWRLAEGVRRVLMSKADSLLKDGYWTAEDDAEAFNRPFKDWHYVVSARLIEGDT